MSKPINKREPCIYKMYNPKEDKYYIGQSIDGLTKRKNKHIRKAWKDKRQNKISLAIREYEFYLEWEVIVYIDTVDRTLEEIQEELNQKEIFYINLYNSIENGYNTQPGGGGCLNPKRRTKEEKELKRKQWRENYYKLHPDKLEARRIRQYASIERRRDDINKQRNARRAKNREKVNNKLYEHRRIREEKHPEKKIERMEKHKAYMKIRNKLKREAKLKEKNNVKEE